MNAKVLLSLVLVSTLAIQGLNANTTNQSGNWENNAIWTPNTSPGLNLDNNTPNPIVESGHSVFIGTTEVNDNLTLTANKGKTLRIEGILTIYGNLTVTGNSWDIVVADGAQLIITGDINFNSNGGGNGRGNGNGNGNGNDVIAELNITGSGAVIVEGDINAKKGGNITGSGFLFVDGKIDGDVNVSSTVNHVIMGTSDNCPPADLMGEIDYSSNNYSLKLTWNMNTEICNPVFFQITRTLDEKVSVFTSNEKSIETYQWIDNNDLTGESEPVYEVRAVYFESGNYKYSEPAELSYINNPLPIELLNFSAKSIDNAVQLTWATAAEINNDFFTIERSSDGNNWEIISYVYGAGNSNYVIDYEYTDEMPLEGISYYRLKQTDFDGQFEYFTSVAVDATKSYAAAEVMNITYNGNSMNVWYQNNSENTIMMIVDLQGRILSQSYLHAGDYTQNISVPLPGNYAGEVVIVKMLSGDKSAEKKFMIR
jgi:hypothetical protein